MADCAAALTGSAFALGFLYRDDRLLTLLTGGAAGQTEPAALAAFRYAARGWRGDPELPRLAATLPEGGCRITHRDSAEIAANDMLALTHVAMGTESEASLWRRDGRSTYLLRLCFLPPDKTRAMALRDCPPARLMPLIAALARHAELRKRSGPPRLQPAARDRIAAILMKSDLRLTLREVEVCTGILLGRTVEAIALDLGIRPASVATYRKRAYRRLGISAQNQLFALCFNELAAR